MTNEELPQGVEQASAYLDGELEATERAAAGADPEVMSAVDSLARVRAALTKIGPVSVIAKDAAIAAALSEFDALQPTSGEPPRTAVAAKVTSLQSRRMRTYRVVTGVAAAAIIGVVAVAALNSSGGGDSDQSTSGTFAAAELPTTKIAATDAAASSGAFDAAGDSAEAAGDTIPSIANPEELTAFAETRELQATTAAPAATVAAAATETSTADAAPVRADQATPAAASLSPSCLSSDEFVLGAIFYQGTPALAVRNTTTGALQAIADADCHLLDEVAAP